MVKAWKIKRELWRIVRQAGAMPSTTCSYLFGARYYDQFLAHKKTVTVGQRPASDHVAVYLIFPSYGVLPSHLRALKYLCSKHYSVIVVSNLPLSDADRDTLLPWCSLCIERPNYGYDFGGYRDGVLHALNAEKNISQLVLLNDSTWFPVHDKTDWLSDAEALGVDFAGAVSNYGIPRPEPEDFRDIEFDYRTDHFRFHYCSFALSIGERILRDPKFYAFWHKFPLSNNKHLTIRRGEIGLTAWVIKHGYAHGSTMDMSTLEASLFALSDDKLHASVRHLMSIEDYRLRSVIEDAVDGLDELDRSDCVKLILTAVARQGAGYVSAYFNIMEQNYPFLKKSPVWLDQVASKKTLAILDHLEAPIRDELKQEAQLFLSR